jgi:DNA-3-methyladenine glycosylase I
MERCEWCGTTAIYQQYHDEEWGVPVTDDRQLFAKLILDGFQAGLSWLTILKKRDNFYKAFDGFDPEKMACYGEDKFDMLMQDAGIIRNRQKIRAAITNARAFLAFQENGNSFSKHLWSFVGGSTIQNHWQTMDELPVKTTESDKMSAFLKALGFKFTGSTICYAFMQAVGMVNDHTTDCFRHRELADLARQMP